MTFLTKGLLMTVLFLLLYTDENVSEEVRRRLCPPMNNVSQPPNRADTLDQIKKLREEMSSTRTVQGPALDAYIVTRYDDHLNDYVNERDKRLQYITGYTGNYGLAIVTKNKLAFWTDEVHRLQSDYELSCNWTLIKTETNLGMITSVAEWLTRELRSGMRVGADPKLMPNSEWELLGKLLSHPSKSIVLIPVIQNLVDPIWNLENRTTPSLPLMTAYVWPEDYAGMGWKEKLNLTREHMKSLDVDALVITSLSEIAWLLNIRGFDLPYGPFLKAYVVVTKDQLHMYTSSEKLTDEVHTHLYTNSCVSAYCTRLHEYDTIWGDLRKLAQQWKRVLLPSMSHFSAGVSRQIYSSIPLEKRKILPSPLINMMAEKNEREKSGMRRAHVFDAVMFCNFSAYFTSEIDREREITDEMVLVNQTNQFRLDDKNSRSISYPTVVASGSNTAIPTYIPTNTTNKIVEKDKPLIIDSGSHYWGGTTALARTFILEQNAILEEHIELYTRILSGLINLATTTFPPHLTTSQLDIIARTTLWDAGLDYPQGSGHGIGVFSNVYESPIDIDYRNGQNTTLKDGYFFVAETAYYHQEQYGMKLSCVLEVVYKNDNSGYLSFQPVTLFPFEHKMINYTMLSIQQRMWLNDYNDRIRSEVGEELLKQNLIDGYNWLIDRLDKIPLVDVQNGGKKLDAESILTYLIIAFVVRCILIV